MNFKNSSGINSLSKLTISSRELFKRKISDVSGNNSGPIDAKRLKVEMSSYSANFHKGDDPDTWFMKNTQDGIEVIFTSSERPRVLGSDGNSIVFSTMDKDGFRSIVSINPADSTNWHKNRNIVWINLDGGEDKRPISEVSGRSSSPIPSKRTKVEISSQNSETLSKNNPDTWILIDNSGGNEKPILSSQIPIVHSTQGANKLYETVDSGGVRSIIRVEGNDNTGWHQNRDIVWINKE